MRQLACLSPFLVFLSILISCLLLASATILLVYAGSGNAEVSRYRNLQFEEMSPQLHPPGDAFVIRLRNLQSQEMTPPPHPPGDAYVTRYRNLQCFEMNPPIHPPGDAFVSRTRNLQEFEMTTPIHPPGDAYVERYRNLQGFEMSPLKPFSTTIESFTTTDENGNNKSSFSAGDTVVMKVVAFGSDQQNIPNALVSVIIQNPNLVPVFINYTQSDIQTGTISTICFAVHLPLDASLGEYVAKVNVYTIFPSEGGEPIVGGHSELSFNVE